MKLNEIIIELINLDKELQNKDVEIKILNDENERLKSEPSSNTKIEDLIISYGKKAMFNDMFYSWKLDVYCNRNNKGDVVYTPIEKWLNNSLQDDKIPYYLSKKDIFNAVYDYAKKVYEKECEKSYEKLLEREIEDKDDE